MNDNTAACPAGRVLLAFYGDDFTGSTDALEVLAAHGLETLLFLRTPSADEIALARQGCAAVGIAGLSRARPVAWMDRHLPAVYRALLDTGAAVCHYKVCSTFDSAPAIGNIGHALLLGRKTHPGHGAVPIVVGAPQLGRYTFFGHLFARAGDQTYRIDRHPSMSRHPITPMDEADLRVHLQRQAPLRIALLDHATQQREDAAQILARATLSDEAVLLDVADVASQRRVGGWLWSLAESARRDRRALFCVGSSGLQYALVARWAELWPERVRERRPLAPAVDRIIVISGSCSPVTGAQIRKACAEGFADIRIDAPALLAESSRAAEHERLRQAATAALARGASPLLYTACGPEDPAIDGVNRLLAEDDRGALLALLARLQGELLRRLVADSGVRRIVVAGGDTSGEVTQTLGLSALTMKARLAPGAPLCDGYTRLGEAPSVEIALKGGQIGDENYFLAARRGRL